MLPFSILAGTVELRFLRRRRNPPQPVRARPARSPLINAPNRLLSRTGPSLACHGRQPKGWAAAVADAQWTRIEAAGFHPLDHGVRHDRHGEREARARTRVHAPAFRPNRARRCSLQVDAQATELRFLRRHRNPSQPVTARPARSQRLPDQQTASGQFSHGLRPLRKHQKGNNLEERSVAGADRPRSRTRPFCRRVCVDRESWERLRQIHAVCEAKLRNRDRTHRDRSRRHSEGDFAHRVSPDQSSTRGRPLSERGTDCEFLDVAASSRRPEKVVRRQLTIAGRNQPADQRGPRRLAALDTRKPRLRGAHTRGEFLQGHPLGFPVRFEGVDRRIAHARKVTSFVTFRNRQFRHPGTTERYA